MEFEKVKAKIQKQLKLSKHEKLVNKGYAKSIKIIWYKFFRDFSVFDLFFFVGFDPNILALYVIRQPSKAQFKRDINCSKKNPDSLMFV